MTTTSPDRGAARDGLAAAILVLLTVTAVMFLSLVTKTAPHPPLDVPLFAMVPFIGASLAIGLAALYLVRRGRSGGLAVALLFALTGLVSYGPQKLLDPNLARIWPAVIVAQAAILVVLFLSWRLRRAGG